MKSFAPNIILFLAFLVTTSFSLTLPKRSDNLVNSLLGLLGLNGLVGNGTPPLGATTIHSPECANTNNGTYLCCQSTFNGDLPIVVAASALTDYPLTKNSINGLVDCRQNFKSCYPGTELCCGIIDLIPAVALYCQQAK